MRQLTAATTWAMLLWCGSASGQDWAKKMFNETSHNFGVVAAGAKTEYRFSLVNEYRDDVHVSGVRTSCGCTTPIVTRDTLKSWEQGDIIAHFNTDRFQGQRGATLTVTFDRPQPAEVQLRVDGFIRSDVVFTPGVVELGTIDQGTSSDQVVTLDYTGRGDWRVVQVKHDLPYLTAEATPLRKDGSHVSYKIRVHLAETSPPGYLNDQLMLVTSDASKSEFPLSVTGRVVPVVSISPSSLSMGVVQPDQEVTKQLVVRAKRPFRVVAVHCDDPAFVFHLDSEAKTLHLIPVSFKAGHVPGKVSQKIRIETDLGRDVTAELTAFAEIASLVQQ